MDDDDYVRWDAVEHNIYIKEFEVFEGNNTLVAESDCMAEIEDTEAISDLKKTYKIHLKECIPTANKIKDIADDIEANPQLKYSAKHKATTIEAKTETQDSMQKFKNKVMDIIAKKKREPAEPAGPAVRNGPVQEHKEH